MSGSHLCPEHRAADYLGGCPHCAHQREFAALVRRIEELEELVGAIPGETDTDGERSQSREKPKVSAADVAAASPFESTSVKSTRGL